MVCIICIIIYQFLKGFTQQRKYVRRLYTSSFFMVINNNSETERIFFKSDLFLFSSKNLKTPLENCVSNGICYRRVRQSLPYHKFMKTWIIDTLFDFFPAIPAFLVTLVDNVSSRTYYWVIDFWET